MNAYFGPALFLGVLAFLLLLVFTLVEGEYFFGGILLIIAAFGALVWSGRRF